MIDPKELAEKINKSFEQLEKMKKEIQKPKNKERKERKHCKECNHKLKHGKCVNYGCKTNKSK